MFRLIEGLTITDDDKRKKKNLFTRLCHQIMGDTSSSMTSENNNSETTTTVMETRPKDGQDHEVSTESPTANELASDAPTGNFPRKSQVEEDPSNAEEGAKAKDEKVLEEEANYPMPTTVSLRHNSLEEEQEVVEEEQAMEEDRQEAVPEEAADVTKAEGKQEETLAESDIKSSDEKPEEELPSKLPSKTVEGMEAEAKTTEVPTMTDCKEEEEEEELAAAEEAANAAEGTDEMADSTMVDSTDAEERSLMQSEAKAPAEDDPTHDKVETKEPQEVTARDGPQPEDAKSDAHIMDSEIEPKDATAEADKATVEGKAEAHDEVEEDTDNMEEDLTTADVDTKATPDEASKPEDDIKTSADKSAEGTKSDDDAKPSGDDAMEDASSDEENIASEVTNSDGEAKSDHSDDDTKTDDDTPKKPPLHRLMVDYKQRKEQVIKEKRENARKSDRPRMETDRFVPGHACIFLNPEKQRLKKKLKQQMKLQLKAKKKRRKMSQSLDKTRKHGFHTERNEIVASAIQLAAERQHGLDPSCEAAEPASETLERVFSRAEPSEGVEPQPHGELAEPSQRPENEPEDDQPERATEDEHPEKAPEDEQRENGQAERATEEARPEQVTEDATKATKDEQPEPTKSLYYPHFIDVQMACAGKKFPEQLMMMMRKKVAEESLWWSSDDEGATFIIDCAWFRDDVMRAFFPNNPYRRITHTLKRWGFQRIYLDLPEGIMAFCHPLFQRNKPELSSRMICQGHHYKAHKARVKKKAEQNERQQSTEDTPKTLVAQEGHYPKEAPYPKEARTSPLVGSFVIRNGVATVHERQPPTEATIQTFIAESTMKVAEGSQQKGLDNVLFQGKKHGARALPMARPGADVPPSVRIASLRKEPSVSEGQRPLAPSAKIAALRQRRPGNAESSIPAHLRKQQAEVVDLTEDTDDEDAPTHTSTELQRAQQGASSRAISFPFPLPISQGPSCGQKRKIEAHEQARAAKAATLARQGSSASSRSYRGDPQSQNYGHYDQTFLVTPDNQSQKYGGMGREDEIARRFAENVEEDRQLQHMISRKRNSVTALSPSLPSKRRVRDPFEIARAEKIARANVLAGEEEALRLRRLTLEQELERSRETIAQREIQVRSEQALARDEEKERRRRLASALYGSGQPKQTKPEPKAEAPKPQPATKPKPPPVAKPALLPQPTPAPTAGGDLISSIRRGQPTTTDFLNAELLNGAQQNPLLSLQQDFLLGAAAAGSLGLLQSPQQHQQQQLDLALSGYLAAAAGLPPAPALSAPLRRQSDGPSLEQQLQLLRSLPR